jgi:hypothetical protein
MNLNINPTTVSTTSCVSDVVFGPGLKTAQTDVFTTFDIDKPSEFEFPGYETLEAVLRDALVQAARGKGAERHARDGQGFEDQIILTLNKELQTNHGAIFQACKKSLESARLKPDAAERELLGAIVYLAAAVIHLRNDHKPT